MTGLIVDAGGSSASPRIDYAASEDAGAERHEHTGADNGKWILVGQAVGQAIERGHRHRDANEAHC